MLVIERKKFLAQGFQPGESGTAAIIQGFRCLAFEPQPLRHPEQPDRSENKRLIARQFQSIYVGYNASTRRNFIFLIYVKRCNETARSRAVMLECATRPAVDACWPRAGLGAR